jgi:(1->4)-alpha-D-glucan 1-alpha-D-glucosylmutase
VGGELDAGGLAVEEFHRLMHHRAATWPHGASASSTHDTKRSEDVRARLHVLSEVPARWQESVLLWRQMNRRFLEHWDGESIPDANEEYLLYQTLVGTWPLEPFDEAGRQIYADRIVQYMEKALREAKLHTSWMNPSGITNRTSSASCGRFWGRKRRRFKPIWPSSLQRSPTRDS